MHVQALSPIDAVPAPTLGVSAMGAAILDDPQVLAALLDAVNKGVADPMVTGMLALLNARSTPASAPHVTPPPVMPLTIAPEPADDDMEIDNDALLPSTLTIRSAHVATLSDDPLPERSAKRARTDAEPRLVLPGMVGVAPSDTGWEQPDEESERSMRLRATRQQQRLEQVRERRKVMLTAQSHSRQAVPVPPREGAAVERRLIVEHVAPHVTADALKRLFSVFGLVNIRLSKSSEAAHVVYREARAAKLAQQELNGLLFEGRTLSIRFLQPVQPRSELGIGRPPLHTVRAGGISPAPVPRRDRDALDEGIEGEENPCIVLVQGLDATWTVPRLLQLLAPCGTVRAIRSLFDPKRLTNRTYTLAEFAAHDEAARAVAHVRTHAPLRASLARGKIYFQTRELIAPNMTDAARQAE